MAHGGSSKLGAFYLNYNALDGEENELSKYYDLIATVDIDIVNPIVDDTSFDYILILGPAPAAGFTGESVDVYGSISEVEDVGFTVTGDEADPVGLAATIAFSQSPTPAKIYIAVQEEETIEEEDDEGNVVETTTLENPTDTIARALNTSGWYVVCPAGIDSSYYAEMAAYIETQEKMMIYTETDFFDNGYTPTVSNIYYRTAGIYGKETSTQDVDEMPEENKYLNVAFAVKWLYYESGSETAAFKTLAGVYTSELSTSNTTKLTSGCLNYFITVGSRNITMNGMVLAGEWMDVIRFRDWLKNDMQVRVVNLFIVNPKIPYTDAGIALVQNQMLASLKAGQDVGGIAQNEYDEDGNVIAGYTTSVPLAADITSSVKASRKLTDCKFKARLAGAIHFAELTGSLTYEM